MKNMSSGQLFKNIVISTIILGFGNSGFASVPTSEFIPYRESDGGTRFRFGDDNAIAVDFTSSSFIFLNRTYWRGYISGNGLVSFTQLFQDSRQELPCPALSLPLICIYWSDADESKGSSEARLTFLETNNAAYLRKISKDIQIAFRNHRRISISWLFVVTWSKVSSHSAPSSLQNTFQLILATDGSASFVLFYYNSLQWMNDGKAKVGFDYGDSIRQFTLPGSCTTNVRSVADNSNIDQPGKWVYQVDSSIVEPSKHTAECYSKRHVELTPKVISIMGNVPLFLEGLCENPDTTIKCSFLDNGRKRPIDVNSTLVGNAIVCTVPFLNTLGTLDVQIVIEEPGHSPVILTESVFVVKDYEFSDLPSIAVKNAEDSFYLVANWDASLLSMESIRNEDKNATDTEGTQNYCEITGESVYIVLLEHDGKTWNNLGPITTSLLNTGVHMSPLNVTLLRTMLSPRRGKITLRTLGIFTKYSTQSGSVLQKLITADILQTTESLMGFALKFESHNITEILNGACETWQSSQPEFLKNTLECPKHLKHARLDWRFALANEPHSKAVNDVAAAVYVQRVPSPSGSSSQCAYDDEERLIWWLPGNGPTFRYSPNSISGYWRYFWEDLLPYMYCCKWDNGTLSGETKCEQFVEKRPINSGIDYILPKLFHVIGTCHITNFEGENFTVAGSGEYWMLKYIDDSMNHFTREFKMQVRMEILHDLEINHENYTLSRITAAVIEEVDSEYEVKVHVDIKGESAARYLSISVDNKELDIFGLRSDVENLPKNDSPWNFQSEFVFYHSTVQVRVKSPQEAVITFATGICLNFRLVVDDRGTGLLNIIGSVGTKWISNITEIGGLLQDDYGRKGQEKSDHESSVKINQLSEKWLVSSSERMFLQRINNIDSIQPVWTVRNQTLIDMTIKDICDDIQMCIFDFNSTASRKIAEETRSTLIFYEEIADIFSINVELCTIPAKAHHGFWSGTSLVEGSTIKRICDSQSSENTDLLLTCAHTTSSEKPVWIDFMGQTRDLSNDNLCDSAVNTTAMPVEHTTMATTTRVDLKLITTPIAESARAEESSSVHGIALILGLAILGVIVAVVIAEYPPLEPVKRLILCQPRNSDLNDDGISLN